MKKGIQFIIKGLFFAFMVQSIMFTKSMKVQAEEGTICEPYTIKICNICGGNFANCEHKEGTLYGTKCDPYRMCNICGQNFSDCEHKEGDSYCGTICEPSDGRICNVCGVDFSICEHKMGTTYGQTECTYNYGQFCNICGQDFTTCDHHRGDTYYSIVCTPHPGMICNVCNDNFQICGHHIGDEDGCTIFAGKICNICNHNFEDSNLCEHHEGDTYDTVCLSYNGKICNICGGNFDTCIHKEGQTYGGTFCWPYDASVCNICHQDFSTCEHHRGEMYGEATTVCTPYRVCNICEERFDSCPHKEGTIYDGTTCAPFTKTICNICGGNFKTCDHKAGICYIMSYGIYNIGDPKQPEWLENKQYDEDYHYDSNVIATDIDKENWNKWNNKAFGADLLSEWSLGLYDLSDAVEAYNHYRSAEGTDLTIDYNKAYEEDDCIRSKVNEYICDAQKAAEELGKTGLASFRITGQLVGVGDEGGYPCTENWQKTIGAHLIWISAEVTINSDQKVNMQTTVHEIDRYNFNIGMSDIATGTPDEINGRFAVLGWAKSFNTIGQMVRNISWTYGDIENSTSISSTGGR